MLSRRGNPSTNESEIAETRAVAVANRLIACAAKYCRQTTFAVKEIEIGQNDSVIAAPDMYARASKMGVVEEKPCLVEPDRQIGAFFALPICEK